MLLMWTNAIYYKLFRFDFTFRFRSSTQKGFYHRDKITKHGMRHTKIYQVWADIKRRIFNVNCKHYKDYGGRGITMFEGWVNNFKAFYDYVSKLPHYGEAGYSLDRINNDGNYEPDNVRWATAKQQSRNVRTNRFVEYQGRLITLSEAAELTGICWKTLEGRIERGETGEYLFRLPRKRQNKTF